MQSLIPVFYFRVSKLHSNDNHVKENANNDCIVNVKNFRTSDKLGQSLSRWQIYPST